MFFWMPASSSGAGGSVRRRTISFLISSSESPVFAVVTSAVCTQCAVLRLLLMELYGE